MFNKLNPKFNLALTLGIIAAFSALLISATHNLTAPVINKNLQAKTQKLYSELFSEMDEYKTTEVNKDKILTSTDIMKDGKVIGYIIEAAGQNSYGDITALVGINDKGEIVGIKYSKFNQTPGFGEKVQVKWYLEQFSKISIKDEIVVENASGATYSSNLVKELVTASAEYAKAKGGK